MSEAIDVLVSNSDEHEVRFTSGETVYIEGLINGQWVGRWWSANGGLPASGERFADAAFSIEVKSCPTGASTVVARDWRWVRAYDTQTKGDTSQHFVVELSHEISAVDVRVHTLLDGTPVFTRWLEITNTSAKPVALTALCPWSGRLWSAAGGLEAGFTLGHAVKWEVLWEGWFGWTPLAPGANVFKNDRGLVWDEPYFVLRNESNGEYFFGQLAWPVNYIMKFVRDNGLTFEIGPTVVNALRVIGPGETIRTPAVHLGHVERDFDAAVQAMHDHIRRSVLLKRKPELSCLVQYLFPEDQELTIYRGDDYDEANGKKCMEVAAAIGVEVFIVDGPTWAEGYGDWVPKRRWFPRGFGPLVECAHEQGLLFGLYAEPEGGRGDWSQTRAFKEHPEWFVPRNPEYPGRNFLNLSIPGAAAYTESQLRQLIEGHRLDLYRHDQNGCLGGEGCETVREGFVENDYWRHYEAFYEICERIHQQYPDLILQQASGGGTRLELATIGRWQESFTSDQSMHPYVYQIACGLSVFLPPEILVTPHGMAGPNQPDLVTMLRGVFALGNTPMIFNSMLPKSIGEFEPGVREKFLHYAEIYKTFIRPMLSTCKVYHHAPVNATGGVESGHWFAMEFTSPDRSKGWATIIRLSEADPDSYLFKPRGLDAKQRYRVTWDNTGRTELADGPTLMEDGISVRTSPPEAGSELLLFEAV